jgi:hypothetical protein
MIANSGSTKAALRLAEAAERVPRLRSAWRVHENPLLSSAELVR